MNTYRLRLTLDAPVAVSRRRDTANRSETRVAVPPPTLRGALAARVQQYGASDDLMEAAFGEAGCRTSALMPVSTSAGQAEAVYPAPLTLRTCKFQGGFRSTATKSTTPHGAEDLLLAALHFALHNDGGRLSSARACQYPGCCHVLAPMSGFVRLDPLDNAWHQQPPPDTRTQAHVGLDRRRRGAASGVLYAREVISEKTRRALAGEGHTLDPTQMQADVIIPPEVIDVFQDAFAPGSTLRVGTARSRGLGRCTVQSFAPADDPLPLISERIDALNTAWVSSCERRGHEAKEGTLITLTLETPALFVDDFLRPNLSPTGNDLLQEASSEELAAAEALASLEQVHQVARTTTVQSWNGLTRFPHPSAQGLAAGSVLVYHMAERSAEVLGALQHIEMSGIGLRRHFGFGRVRVCHPIHSGVHEHSTAAPRAET